jgi:serine protease AprX
MVAALSLGLGAPALSMAREQPTWPSANAGPIKADRDGDGVFDDLEARLRGLGRQESVGVIVSLTAPATAARVQRIRQDMGGFELKHRYRVVDAFAATVRAGQIQGLVRRPDVAHVEEDSVVRAFNDSAQESFGVTKARLDLPWLDGDRDGNPAAYSPADLVAAVIDSGIDASHRDLDGGKVLAFKDYVGTRTTPYDDEGHGTHVAATIAGDGDARMDLRHRGVAPAAGLVGVKVLDHEGSGRMSDVAAGIDWVVANQSAHGIDAINLSLGTDGCSDGTDAASRAVDNAHDAGLVVAVAAGNEGPGTCTIGSPGAARKALTVGAMADLGEDGFFQAWFSSRGRTVDGRIKPDLSAPGWRITSADANTLSGYAEASGTSMATPFVAGVALLMRDASPTLTSDAIKSQVMSTAVDWGRGGDNRSAGTTGPDIDYGAGRLDAYAALAAAGAPLTAPPPVPAHALREGSLSGQGARVDYQFSVTDTRFPIAATMHMADVTAGTSANPNFDLYLLGPTGTQLAASTFDTRQEEVYHRPTATGTYTVRVQSRRGSGNFFVDVSGGLAQPPPDPTPPETTIVSAPPALSNSSSASFSFTSSEPESSFECRLDEAGWEACSSPRTFSDLADGPHVFAVRATDADGNTDPDPPEHRWAINTSEPKEPGEPSQASPPPDHEADGSGNAAPLQPAASDQPTNTVRPPDTEPPTLSLTAPSRRLKALFDKGARLRATCSEPCSLLVRLRLDKRTARKLGLNRRVGRVKTTLTAERRSVVMIRLNRKARRAMKRQPRLVRRSKLMAVAAATDAAGNAARRSIRVRLR